MNRYNAAKPMQGMFVKTPKKKKKVRWKSGALKWWRANPQQEEGDDKASEASPTKKKAPKKRGKLFTSRSCRFVTYD